MFCHVLQVDMETMRQARELLCQCKFLTPITLDQRGIICLWLPACSVLPTCTCIVAYVNIVKLYLCSHAECSRAMQPQNVSTLACAACRTVDSIIASLTGLDQSKYAEYEWSTEECTTAALKVLSCTFTKQSRPCTDAEQTINKQSASAGCNHCVERPERGVVC